MVAKRIHLENYNLKRMSKQGFLKGESCSANKITSLKVNERREDARFGIRPFQ